MASDGSAARREGDQPQLRAQGTSRAFTLETSAALPFAGAARNLHEDAVRALAATLVHRVFATMAGLPDESDVALSAATLAALRQRLESACSTIGFSLDGHGRYAGEVVDRGGGTGQHRFEVQLDDAGWFSCKLALAPALGMSRLSDVELLRASSRCLLGGVGRDDARRICWGYRVPAMWIGEALWDPAVIRTILDQAMAAAAGLAATTATIS
ncbi:MAG: hypothetical protein ACTHU0_18885 [Kofleriaceae bacterium]